jgi:hypothetical protein
MSEEKNVVGACLCEAVRFEISLPTLFCGHCHCTMCQRNHGAAYVTWFSVAPEQLEILSGEETLVRYASSKHGSRTFCSACGTSLFCRNDGHPDRVDIPLANMQGGIDRAPQLHIHVGTAAHWAHSEDGLPRLGGKTGLEPV